MKEKYFNALPNKTIYECKRRKIQRNGILKYIQGENHLCPKGGFLFYLYLIVMMFEYVYLVA